MTRTIVTYVHNVYAIVDHETQEVVEVVSDKALDPDSTLRNFLMDGDSGAGRIDPLGQRGQEAIQIAQTADWPAWSFD